MEFVSREERTSSTDPVALTEHLPGVRIADIKRLGKFISIELQSAAPDSSTREPIHLVIHLGMTGQLTLRSAGEVVAPHTHGFFGLDDGRELRYTDIRRFGQFYWFPNSSMASFQGRLGSEPLEIPLAEFCAQFHVPSRAG